MLRKPISFLLIFLTLSSGFTKLFFYAGYELNKNYIATVLCENKDKPKMECHGKCYLKKKLDQAKKQDQQKPQTESKRYFSDHFLLSQYRFKSFIRQTETYMPAPPQSYYYRNDKAIFHPPQA